MLKIILLFLQVNFLFSSSPPECTSRIEAVLGDFVTELYMYNKDTGFKSNSQRLIQVIADSSKPLAVTIVNRPRIGKTMILHRLGTWFSQKKGWVLYIDAYLLADAEKPVDSLLEIIKENFYGTIPTEIMDLVRAETDFFVALKKISEAAKRQNKQVLFLLDEAGAIIGTNWGNFQERILQQRDVYTVLSYTVKDPRIIPTIKEQIKRSASSAEGVQNFEILPESVDSVKQYVQDLASKANVTITDEAVEALYNLSNGWPYQLNILISCMPENKKVITRDDIFYHARREAQKRYPNLVF